MWRRLEPGLYRFVLEGGVALVERGDRLGMWWWSWRPKGGAKHDMLYGREMTLRTAKAIVEAVAKQDAAEQVPF
jgi:hypothetical protein